MNALVFWKDSISLHAVSKTCMLTMPLVQMTILEVAATLAFEESVPSKLMEWQTWMSHAPAYHVVVAMCLSPAEGCRP